MARSHQMLLLIVLIFLGTVSCAENYLNVYGKPLEDCSTKGMALTGFTRDGTCTDEIDDQGSHHICIDLTSTTGGNFCMVTSQPDWCSSQMPCVGDPSSDCQVQSWCVCQWAFASYIENAGGCSQIQDIMCGATNMEAYKAYEKEKDNDPKIAAALECLEERCGIATSLSQ